MIQTIWRSLLLLKERKKMVVFLVFANFIFAILVLVEPIFYKKIIDILVSFQIEGKTNISSLNEVLLIWFFVGLVIIVSRLGVSIFADRLSHEEFNQYILKFFNHCLHLSMFFHVNTSSGKLSKELIRGADNLFYLHLDFFRRVIPDMFTIILLVPLMLYLNIHMGIFVIISGVLIIFFALTSASRTFHKQESIEKYYTKLSSFYNDTFGNIGIVKSYTLEKEKFSHVGKFLQERLEKQYPILYWWGFLISFGKIVNIIISLGVILLGSYLFTLGKLSIGDIVMFLGFSNLFLVAVEGLMWSLDGFFWRIASIKEFFGILNQIHTVVDIPNAKRLSKVIGRVEFENVDFGYDVKRKVLKKVSFVAQPGKKIAFVGHTGSGKTTTSSLLLRFYEPNSGKILIDGVDIASVTQESLRQNIGVVFQDNSLFNATIKENVLLGNTKLSREDFQKILHKSHVDEFIKKLPDRENTLVGERGVKLSGGEKQRLAIARALVKNAPILILDEATSALDAQTEKFLQSSLQELMKSRTTFIIAHRLSTIKKADLILVFEDGNIVEQGTYESLYKQNGIFTKLVEAQVDGFIHDEQEER